MFEHFSLELLILSIASNLANLIISDHNALADFIFRTNGFVVDAIRADIDAQTLILEQVEDSILADISEQTDILVAQSTFDTQRVIDQIVTQAVVLESQVDAMQDRVLNEIAVAQNDVASRIVSGTGTVIGAIGRQTDTLQNTLSSIDSRVTASLGAQTSILGSIVDILGDGIGVTITNQINIDQSIFEVLVDQVSDAITEGLIFTGNIIETITGTLGGIIDALIAELFSAGDELVTVARDIVAAILHNKDIDTGILAESINDDAQGMGGRIFASVLNNIEPGADALARDLRSTYVDFINIDGCVDKLNQPFKELMKGKIDLDSWAAKSFEIITKMIGLVIPFITISQARAQRELNAFLAVCPTFPLPVAETVLALQRGLINEATAAHNIRQAGFSGDDAEKIVNVGFTAPDLSLVFNMHYRDLIDDAEYDDLLKRLGYTGPVIDRLKTLAFFIPPVQDLISMAVKEVFTPEIAEVFGQFKEFPEEFEKFARQQGVSEFWAQNYWAQHWALPSVQMGFEMLHRGVITQPELEKLLKALDVMPGWRENLIKISFRPFTRVDIRRMHRVDVLDDGEVLAAYKDLGYDQEKAQKLTDFVLEINKDDEIITLDVASDLTRSSILSFYKDGILSKSVTLALLIQAGINIAAAELFILGADFDIERAERRSDLELILDQFRFAGATFTESADAILALDLEAKERELALLDLEKVSQVETRLPSKADLDKFLANGIIENKFYVEMLERLGYPAVWADRYLQLEVGAAA